MRVYIYHNIVMDIYQYIVMDSFQFSRHDRWSDLDSLELIFFIKYFIPIVKIQSE